MQHNYQNVALGFAIQICVQGKKDQIGKSTPQQASKELDETIKTQRETIEIQREVIKILVEQAAQRPLNLPSKSLLNRFIDYLYESIKRFNIINKIGA